MVKDEPKPNSRFKITKRTTSNESKADETVPLFVSTTSSGIGSMTPTPITKRATSILARVKKFTKVNFFLKAENHPIIEGKNVAFSPYNTIHDGSDGMSSEFRKVISKCVNESKIARQANSPVVSKAYIESLDKEEMTSLKMTLLRRNKLGK